MKSQGSDQSLRATAIGFVAVLLWALLAVLTAASGNVPPFQLVAMSFAIATFIGIINVAWRGGGFDFLKTLTPAALSLGVGGLFGFHFFYFLSLRNAPALEASLIIYLWPLLIVLFSALLPGEKSGGRLRWWHVAGALLGLAGALLIVTSSTPSGASSVRPAGYLFAAVAALIWSGYSVSSRLFAHVPSSAVMIYCAVTAVGAAIAHLVFEDTQWPHTTGQWLAIAGLGLGPVGGAFYVWDYGMKHGDIRVLGAGAYMAPLFSTLILVASGVSQATPRLWLACLAITAGALLAGHDLFSRRSP